MHVCFFNFFFFFFGLLLVDLDSKCGVVLANSSDALLHAFLVAMKCCGNCLIVGTYSGARTAFEEFFGVSYDKLKGRAGQWCVVVDSPRYALTVSPGEHGKAMARRLDPVLDPGLAKCATL